MGNPLTPLGDPIPAAPCPFCAATITIIDATLRDGCRPGEIDAFAYAVRCQSCAATGGWAKSETSAMRYWNMRSTQEVSRG